MTTTEKTDDQPIKKAVIDTDHPGDIKSGDFSQDISVESGALAIVDAAILDGVDSPLAQKAIVVPMKWDGQFTITGKFEDAILGSVTIKPKRDQLGNVADAVTGKATDADKVIQKEAVIPGKLSNDDSIHRRMRKVWSKKARDHMAGKKRHKPDPTRRITPMRKRGTIKKNVQEMYDFVEATSRSMMVTREDIDKVSDKNLLGEMIEKLFMIGMEGWTLDGDTPVHSSGIRLNSKELLVKNGLLYDADGVRPNINFEWVYMVRQAIKEYKLSQNVNMVEDFLNHDGPIFG